MKFGSPFGKDWKPKKQEEAIETFKPIKPKVSSSSARQLVEFKGVFSREMLLWIDRWLEQLVREHSYPPQIVGKEAFSVLSRFLPTSDALKVLENIRLDFRNNFPLTAEVEELEYLNEALALETPLFNE
jgi:hypothetical protein